MFELQKILEFLNSDIIKYGAFLLGMVATFYIIIGKIPLNKKFFLMIILGFFLGGIGMWLFVGGFNKFLFPIFWIISTIIVGAFLYREKIVFRLTRYNILIVIILLMTIGFQYSREYLSITIVLGLFLLFYIVYIPYITGLKKIGQKSKFILYFVSWVVIGLLCLFHAPETIELFKSIHVNITLSEIIHKFKIVNNTELNVLDLFVKGLIISYIWMLISYSLGVYFNKKDIKINNKKTDNIMVTKTGDSHNNSIEILKGIILVVSIIIINHFLHIINDYTLTSLILFLNLSVYNKLLVKKKI